MDEGNNRKSKRIDKLLNQENNETEIYRISKEW